MGHIGLSGISTFWRTLDDLRAILGASGPADAAVPGLVDSLLGQVDLVPEPMAATRRKVLADLAACHGLTLRPAPRGPGLGGDGPWPLEALAAPPLPGVSLVTCCKNRNENLMRALPTWLAQPEISEIVIVDWCSDRPVAGELADAGFDDPRIRVARAEDEPRWILSYAFNLGFRLARYDRILKADADITLDRGFFKHNPLPPNSFIAGNWRLAGTGQSFVNGFFYTHKADLLAVNGFNEHITTYGWDDDELYDRLEAAGIARVDVAGDTIRHLDHDDDARMDDRPDARASGWDDLRAWTMYKIRTNRLISTIMPRWDGNRVLLPFDVHEMQPGRLRLRRRGWVPHPVPEHIRERAELLASWEILSWKAGLRTWELPPEALDRILRLRRLDAIQHLHVELALAGASDALLAAPRHLVVDMTENAPHDPARLAALAAAGNRALVLRTADGTPPEGLPAGAGVLPLWAPIGPVPDVLPEVALAGDERAALRLVPGAALPEAVVPASPAVLPDRPRLFVDAQHGLGNRLRAIGSGAAVAAATGREMVVVWEPDHHCEARLSDLFDYDGAVIEECFLDRARAEGQTVLNYMEIEDGSAKGAPLDLVDGRDAYVRSAYVITHPASHWESENRLLRQLAPSAPVRALMASVPDHRDIALHIRMEGAPGTDTNSYDARENWTEEGHKAINEWRSKSHYTNFLRRLEPMLAEHPGARMYLAADMPETYAAFRAAHGDRVAFLERGVYDRSVAQLHYALADLLLLARCRILLGSNWSSFSEVALRLSSTITHREMSGVDF